MGHKKRAGFRKPHCHPAQFDSRGVPILNVIRSNVLRGLPVSKDNYVRPSVGVWNSVGCQVSIVNQYSLLCVLGGAVHTAFQNNEKQP